MAVRFFGRFAAVRDLLLRAKHLFVAAKFLGPAHQRGLPNTADMH
jgi:hypothetical protein